MKAEKKRNTTPQIVAGALAVGAIVFTNPIVGFLALLGFLGVVWVVGR